MKRKIVIARPPSSIYERIRKILDSARSNVARSVNTTQVIANWLIGREIVEEEQKGMSRAGYGEELILDLSTRLTSDYGKGYSKDNLFWFRRFYQGYPKLVDLKFDAVRQISDAPPRKSMTRAPGEALPPILHIPRGALRKKGHAVRSLSPDSILNAPRAESWKPGHLGLILCTDKNDAVVRYTLGANQRKTISASRYKLHLPSEAELRAELRREVRMLSAPTKTGKAK